ncbi:hypothetical protein PFISCL1PPCAC_25386, partial [Pristionchus fissidentatus]
IEFEILRFFAGFFIVLYAMAFCLSFVKHKKPCEVLNCPDCPILGEQHSEQLACSRLEFETLRNLLFYSVCCGIATVQKAFDSTDIGLIIYGESSLIDRTDI